MSDKREPLTQAQVKAAFKIFRHRCVSFDRATRLCKDVRNGRRTDAPCCADDRCPIVGDMRV